MDGEFNLELSGWEAILVVALITVVFVLGFAAAYREGYNDGQKGERR